MLSLVVFKITNNMISGETFNSDYPNKKVIKLTVENDYYNDFQYKEGLNELNQSFNEWKICGPGGLYCCFIEDFSQWLEYNDKVMTNVWDVTIPDDAKVVVMDDKIKVNKFILSNARFLQDDLTLNEKAVEQNGLALRFVRHKDRTENICLKAVKQNGMALEYVLWAQKTHLVCRTAVEQNGDALQFVPCRSLDMCKVAVKQNGLAIRHVPLEFRTCAYVFDLSE